VEPALLLLLSPAKEELYFIYAALVFHSRKVTMPPVKYYKRVPAIKNSCNT
jgi:hypothetical protein